MILRGWIYPGITKQPTACCISSLTANASKLTLLIVLNTVREKHPQYRPGRYLSKQIVFIQMDPVRTIS